MAKKSMSASDMAQKNVLSALAEIGGSKVNDDDLTFEGKKFIIPETMEPMGAIKFLKEHIIKNETETTFSRTFNYRPYDGAHAFDLALKHLFGAAGIGKAIQTMFGDIPPELKEINTDVDETVQIPYGRIQVPMIEGDVYTKVENHPEYGPLFKLEVNTKRKYRSHVEGMFKVIEEMLRTQSIYKGKAIDGQMNPEFLDVRSLDESKIVFNDDVFTQLDANVWSLLDHTDKMEELGLPLKRSVLLEGPYGTGKSSAGWITAKRALNNGWTFVMCRPGRDNLQEVMQTARLYQPAVVFFEDIDTISDSGDSMDVTKLLDLFDGISSKGTKLMALMTTNNVDRIHKGMLRPGRLDSIIHIGMLDETGVERLIKSVVSEDILEADIDWTKVAVANENYLPAYVKEGVDRALRYIANGEKVSVGTEELVASAMGLRRQWQLHEEAGEGETTPTLDTAIREAVADVIHNAEFTEDDGEPARGEYATRISVRDTQEGYKASKV